MPDTNAPRPARLVGFALVGIGALELVGLLTGPLFARELHLDASLLALPAGLALLAGWSGWVTPAVRVFQALVVVGSVAAMAVLLEIAVPVSVVAFGTGVAEFDAGQRAVGAALLVTQAGLWVWVFDLGRRLVVPGAKEAA